MDRLSCVSSQQKKCERYWVDMDESPLQLGPFVIICVSMVFSIGIRTLNSAWWK